jgi:hypothetical protein
MTPVSFAAKGKEGSKSPLEEAESLLLPIDVLFEFLANLEEGQPLGRNLDALSGLWVPSRVGVIFADDEASESPDFDPAVFYKLIG